MTIKDCMKTQFFSVKSGASLKEVFSIFLDKKIGTLPVINSEDKLIGVITLSDVLNLFLPDFLKIIKNIDFVKDFGATELEPADIEKIRKMTADEIMTKEPISVEDDCMLIRALSLIKTNIITDLLVTDKTGKLVGVASSVDIGRKLLENYEVKSCGDKF